MAKTYEENSVNNNSKLIMDQNYILRSYIENMSDALFIIDREYKNVPLNNSARKLFEYANENIEMHDMYQVIKKINFYDFEFNIINNMDEILFKLFNRECAKIAYFELEISDTMHYYSINYNQICDKNNEIEKILFSVRDVTEQVKNDFIIRYQKEELELILNNISDKIIVIDKNGDYIKLNKALLDNPLTDIRYAKNIESVYDYIEHLDFEGNVITLENTPVKKLLRGEKFSDYKLNLNSVRGQYYYEVAGIPLFDSNGDFYKGILIYHDITDKLNAEENTNIKNQDDIISSFVENVNLRYIKLSYPDLKIVEMNKKAYFTLRQLNPEIKTISNLIGDSYFKYTDITKEDIDNMINNKTSLKFIRYLESFKLYLKYIYQPIYKLNGQVKNIICMVTDVTEDIKEKNKEEQMIRFQDNLIINVSHELKTPLNIIHSSVQLMDIYMNNFSENNKEHLLKIKQSVEKNCYRLTKLINNIVDLSNLEEGRYKLSLKNENIVEIIENIADSVSDYVKEKKQSIVFDTEAEEIIMACDSDVIERIMLNLISNAIKFNSNNGKILINILEKGDNIEISVEDTGDGIDKGYMDNLFDRFSIEDKSLSRKAEGSGIGLKLVKSLVKLHGGNISVTSKIGEGSKFFIELPVKTLPDAKQYLNLKYEDKIEMMDIEFSDIYDND